MYSVSPHDIVEIRHLDENNNPITDWCLISRFLATGMVGNIEIREWSRTNKIKN